MCKICESICVGKYLSEHAWRLCAVVGESGVLLVIMTVCLWQEWEKSIPIHHKSKNYVLLLTCFLNTGVRSYLHMQPCSCQYCPLQIFSFQWNCFGKWRDPMLLTLFTRPNIRFLNRGWAFLTSQAAWRR